MIDKPEDDLRTLEERWSQALINNDAGSVNQFVADDWKIVTPDGRVIERAIFLGLIASGMLSHECMDCTELAVRVYGDAAVATFRATSKGTFRGVHFSETERATDVFVKQDGIWKCVLTQLTRIAG